MKLILAIHPSGNLSVPNSNTWYNNLFEPLVDLGHDVVYFDIREFCRINNLKFHSKEYKSHLSEYFLSFVKDQLHNTNIDLIITYFTDNDIEISSVQELQKLGIPIANFSCNNTHQFHLVSNISPYFTYSLHSELDSKDKFLKINANPIYFQMASNPKYYTPSRSPKFQYDLSFVGSNYALRSKYIYALLKNNIKVDCFGPNWNINRPYQTLRKLNKEFRRYSKGLKNLIIQKPEKRFELTSEMNYYDLQNLIRSEYREFLHYPLADTDVINTYHTTKINLGFLEVFGTDNNSSSLSKMHLHLREFEIPMSGALYMTNYSDELATCYIPDIEVITYRNAYELIDKSKYYLSHENEALKIRKAGYSRALKSHTYHTRFRELFTKIKLH